MDGEKARAAQEAARSGRLAAAISVSLGLSLQLLIAAFGPGRPMTGTRAIEDERYFHIPLLRSFAEQWPTPDLSDYGAAMTPGYHLVLSWMVRFGGQGLLDDGLWILRLVSGLIPTALIGLLAWWAGRRLGWLCGVAMTLPMLMDPYLSDAFGFLMPDATAWLLLTGLLLVTLTRLPWRRTVMVAGLLLLLAVGVRQVTVWLAGMVWLSAWLGDDHDKTPARIVPHPSELELTQRVPRALIGLLATLPAIAMLAWFVHLWGGLVPPAFSTEFVETSAAAVEEGNLHTGGNTGFPAISLLTFGGIGLFFLPMAWPTIRDGLRSRGALWFIAGGAGVGLLAGVLGETTYGIDVGRWGAHWALAKIGPVIADRSLVILLGSVFGGAVLGAILAALPSRARLLLLAAAVGFILTNSFNAKAWVRYVQPFVLIWMALAVVEVWRGREVAAGALPRWRIAGPVLLAAGFGLISMRRIFF